jgi:hypothetical protein
MFLPQRQINLLLIPRILEPFLNLRLLALDDGDSAFVGLDRCKEGTFAAVLDAEGVGLLLSGGCGRWGCGCHKWQVVLLWFAASL